MNIFDKIISEKLNAANDYPASQSMWDSISKTLESSSVSNNGSKAAFYGGIAAAIVLGVFFTQLPDIGSIQPDQVSENITVNDETAVHPTLESHPTATSSAPDKLSFSPQEEHEIVFVSSETVKLSPLKKQNMSKASEQGSNEEQKSASTAGNSTKSNEAKPSNFTASEASYSFDFKATGIQCSGGLITFQCLNNVDQVEWIVDGVQVLSGKLVEYTFDEEGTHEVVMLIKDARISTSVRKEIEIYGQPDPIVSVAVKENSSCFKQIAKFEAEPGNNDYRWTIGDADINGAEASTALGNGNHNIQLTSINEHGCVSKHSELLVIENGLTILCPNAFSPGNNDGTNDTWFPVGLESCERFTLRVYNLTDRSLVYETNEIAPWNGRLMNGAQSVARGQQFLYEIMAVDPCGYTEKIDGTITVVQ